MNIRTISRVQERLHELHQIKRMLAEAPMHPDELRISSLEFALLYLTEHMIVLHNEALALLQNEQQKAAYAVKEELVDGN